MIKLIPLVTLALLGSALAQTAKHEKSADEPATTLCDLLANASGYNGKSVTVKATYASGEEYAILKDDSCQPAPDKTKLVLATFSSKYQFKSALDKKLHKLVKKNQQAEVTVVGIFTDPGHNIGHQGCCRYKLEVHQLLDVEEATPQAAQALPVVTHADIPTYPPIAKTARISGKVQVQVTVKDGTVTETKLLSSTTLLLVTATMDNIKTWRFAGTTSSTFSTTFVYEIEKGETSEPVNPTIELHLPTLVKITAKPLAPTVNYSAQVSADVPRYPVLARTARVFGTVEVQVTVKDGVVTATEIKSGHKLLTQATIDNIKTWRFEPNVNTTLTTKFNYRIETEKPLSTDPIIKLQLPYSVTITTVPPIIDSQSAQTAQVQSTDFVDPNTGNLHLTIPLVAAAKPGH